MRLIWLLILTFPVEPVFAQWKCLYLVDEYNGRYIPVKEGSTVNLMVKPTGATISGILGRVDSNRITLYADSGSVRIVLDDIQGIMIPENTSELKQDLDAVTDYVLITGLTANGVASLVGGILIMGNQPMAGSSLSLIGLIGLTGAYGMYKKMEAGPPVQDFIKLDQYHHRLIIR